MSSKTSLVIKKIQHICLISMCAASVSLLFPSICLASEETYQKIKEINKEMEQLSEELIAERKKQASIQEELREHDLIINNLNKKIVVLDKQIAVEQKELAQQQKNEKTLNKDIEIRREHLGQSLRALYATGQQPDIKLLFNQNDMVDFNRLITYYQFFNQSLQDEIIDLNEKVEEQTKLRETIESTKEKLEEEKKKQNEQKAELAAEQKERKSILASVEKTINTKDKALKELQASEKELQQVLAVAQGTLAQKKWPPVKGSFDKQKGKLPWPTMGKVRNTFGSYRTGGQSRYNGMVITAPVGQTVSAVAPGRVVYADWLRGYGLLVIIDHGNNYMSLYAHNDMLYTTVGASVKDGDPVGTVGTTGGLKQPGLYFEIRHNGKPVNPQPWLAPRN